MNLDKARLFQEFVGGGIFPLTWAQKNGKAAVIGGITNGWGGYVSGGNRGGYAGTASRWGQKDLGTEGRHKGRRTDSGEDEGEKKRTEP